VLYRFEIANEILWVIRDKNSALLSREREVSGAIGEVMREGDPALLRKHMKRIERLLRGGSYVWLKRSLSTSCDLLLKQLICVKVSFECLLSLLSGDFITP
jgi:hypothetical protein